MQRKLVEKVNKSVSSIIADESSDLSKTEHLSLTLRYLDDGVIKEDFLTFVDVMDEAHGEAQKGALEDADDFASAAMEPTLTGTAVGSAILATTERLGLKMRQCVGQGYAGAASMSSEVKGASATVKKQLPLAD